MTVLLTHILLQDVVSSGDLHHPVSGCSKQWYGKNLQIQASKEIIEHCWGTTRKSFLCQPNTCIITIACMGVAVHFIMGTFVYSCPLHLILHVSRIASENVNCANLPPPWVRTLTFSKLHQVSHACPINCGLGFEIFTFEKVYIGHWQRPMRHVAVHLEWVSVIGFSHN
jgi:hypothetical protein